MLVRDKGNFHAQCENRTRDPPVLWLERPKSFVVPGGHGFSSFQVESVHWKCVCA